jgi:hypothetical protein
MIYQKIENFMKIITLNFRTERFVYASTWGSMRVFMDIFDWYVVKSYGMEDRGSIPTEAEDFSSNLCVQAGSGAHPASHTVGTGGSFPGCKARPGRDADHSPPSSAEIKKEWELYLLAPQVPPRRIAGQLYFYVVKNMP